MTGTPGAVPLAPRSPGLGRRARRGAAIGAALALVGLTGALGAYLGTRLGIVVDVLLGAALGAVLLGVSVLAVTLLRLLLGAASRLIGFVGVGMLGALAAMLVLFVSRFAFPWGLAWVALVWIGAPAVVGAAAALLRSPEVGAWRWPGRVTLGAAGAGGLLAAGSLIAWLAWPGGVSSPVPVPADPSSVAPLDAPDPSQPGAHRVRLLTYGAGDRQRPEFDSRADVRSRAVDVTPVMRGLTGLDGRLRRWYRGHGLDAYPLNGRVWLPEGPGPFPLVLIQHGNADIAEPSDAGYGYLAELLASHGFLAVTPDENYLNRSPIRTLSNENPARGFVLLQHVALWSEWQRTPGHPFFGKVDMENIALVGHSRGGEGIAVAAAFNRLSHYPEDATVRFRFGFAIKALVALASTDGQYNPGGNPLALRDISYLALQGSHDGAVPRFVADRVYGRIRFTDGRDLFKSTLYIHRANHSHFNTVWSPRDVRAPDQWLLNRARVLAGEAQRHVAKVYVMAFLQATLRNDRRYRSLFRDHRRARHWLPDTIYVNRYSDASFRALADFEEDADPGTTTAPGGRIEGEGLALWRERDASLRGGLRRGANAAYLGWRPGSGGPTPFYAISLPDGYARAAGLSSATLLSFDMALPNDEVSMPGGWGPGPRPDRIDLTVELESDGTVVARLPLSHFRSVPPLLRARLSKSAAYEAAVYQSAAESVFQTYELPLGAFVAVEPRLAPARLTAVRFRFDRADRGMVILDDIGFAAP